MELGKKYFYIHQDSEAIKEGVLVNYGIETHSGYGIAYFPIEDNGKKNVDKVEDSLIFETLPQAEYRLGQIQPIWVQAKEIADEATEKQNALRELVIGKPKYEDII